LFDLAVDLRTISIVSVLESVSVLLFKESSQYLTPCESPVEVDYWDITSVRKDEMLAEYTG